MRIIGYRPYHLRLIDVQPVQAFALPMLHEQSEVLGELGPAWTGVHDGHIIGCAGFWAHDDYATAWAVLSKRIGHQFLALHRAVVRSFKTAPWSRIEALVRHDFEQGERWAVSLGFIRQRQGHTTGPDGNEYDLWTFHV